jgi:hypothetical protein
MILFPTRFAPVARHFPHASGFNSLQIATNRPFCYCFCVGMTQKPTNSEALARAYMKSAGAVPAHLFGYALPITC